MVQARIKGRGASSGAGDPEDLTGAEALLAMGIGSSRTEIDDLDRSANVVGSFTMVPSGNSTPGSPTGTFTGQYYRIGNLVFVRGSLNFTSNGGMIGIFRIDGFPFNAATAASFVTTIMRGVSIASPERRYYLYSSALNKLYSFAYYRDDSSSGPFSVNAPDIPDDARIEFSFVYLTDDA